MPIFKPKKGSNEFSHNLKEHYKNYELKDKHWQLFINLPVAIVRIIIKVNDGGKALNPAIPKLTSRTTKATKLTNRPPSTDFKNVYMFKFQWQLQVQMNDQRFE